MIKIFYGPNHGFDNILPEEINSYTLTELIDIHDMKINSEENNLKRIIESGSKLNLIVRTHEYARLSNSGFNGFLSLLQIFNIDNMYFQNPPSIIENQLRKEKSEKIIVERYDYKKVNMDRVEIFYNKYNNKVLGQEGARINIASSLYRIAKDYNNDKPLVLLFWGPSGVGKTESAKLIADTLGEKLFRKQFSMYQNIEFGNYVFGGSHSDSSLARDLLERESNVILFDEFDKFSQLFHSAFYQMFDEGIFEDKNYKVNLKNSIIICTSNFLSEQDIRRALGEPIYNRIDSTIQFQPLSTEIVEKLIESSLNNVYKNLSNDEKKFIDKEEVLELLFELKYNILNARAVDKYVKNYIFTMIVSKKFSAEN